MSRFYHNVTVKITDTVIDTVKDYVSRSCTRSEAAARIGVSERQFTRLVSELGVERDPGPTVVQRAEGRLRKAQRRRAAELVKMGRLTVERAAERCGCSPRTIYRYLDKL